MRVYVYGARVDTLFLGVFFHVKAWVAGEKRTKVLFRAERPSEHGQLERPGAKCCMAPSTSVVRWIREKVGWGLGQCSFVSAGTGGGVVPFANYMDRDERPIPGTVDRASALNPLGLLRGANCGN